jgi:excisionase family DNA binding protein
MITVTQAAVILKVHPSLVRRWIQRGVIKAEKVTPRLYLIDPQDLSTFALTKRNKPGRPPKEQSK